MEHISPEQQRLILEKLHRSDDALTTTAHFNEKHDSNLGEHNMPIHEFARFMKDKGFKSHEVESITREVSGQSIDLETEN